MEDIFTNDIFSEIMPPSNKAYSLIGLSLPSNQDIYFMAKWHELFERYQSARLFLRKAYEGEWESWFNPAKDDNEKKTAESDDYIRWFYKAELYETALVNYNMLVDLSWAMTYVCAEFMLYKFDKDGNVVNAGSVQGMHPIDEAMEMLRKVENGTVAPTAEDNPFEYLKKMAPQFEGAVNLIINFWNKFGNSDIRILYNFIKHKGKPVYAEQEKYTGYKAFGLRMGDQDYPTDIRDVQKKVSVENGIKELIAFDDDELFPYIKELIEDLKKAVNPSPMVM